MPSKQTKHKTKSAPPQRPFPWRCPECGEKSVDMETTVYDAEVRHDGRPYTLAMPDLEIPICRSCGAKVFTETVDEQINGALRDHLNLLTPDQIRGALQRIGISQKDLAAQLGVAEATLSRWMNASQIQSRSMDTLLRIYFGFPQVRQGLLDHAHDSTLGLSDVVGVT